MWKIQKIISKGDYNYVLVPDHPNATKNGYVLEHRVVMENHLGRLLGPSEVVHHKNGSGKDNRLENLTLETKAEHSSHHVKSRGVTVATLKCPSCKGIFKRRKGQTHLDKGGKVTCCSRKCKGKFNRLIQLGGRTPEVERAISENVLKIEKIYDNSEQTEK